MRDPAPIFVEPHGMKRLRREGANHAIDVARQARARARCRDGDRNHEFCGVVTAQGDCGCAHRRAGCQPVVDNDDRLSAELRCGTSVAIGLLASRDLGALACDGGVQLLRRDPQRLDELFVDDAGTVAG